MINNFLSSIGARLRRRQAGLASCAFDYCFGWNNQQTGLLIFAHLYDAGHHFLICPVILNQPKFSFHFEEQFPVIIVAFF